MPGRRRRRVKFDRASSGGRSRRAPGLGGEPGARRRGVAADRAGERRERVVARFVAQFVQQFHADEFTVAPLAAERAPASRSSAPRAGRGRCRRPSAAGRGWRRRRAARRARPCTRTTKMPIAAGLRMRGSAGSACESRRRGRAALAERAAELGAVDDVAADAVGPAEQRRRPASCRRRRARRAPPSSRRAGRAPRSSSCARRRSRARAPAASSIA